MNTILTLRHAATDAAKRRVILGRIDHDINSEGRASIADYLESNGPIEVDRVISSPLQRALSTASAISGRDYAAITTEPLCLERNYGGLQGIEPERVSRVTPKVFYLEVGGISHSLNPPNGETLEQLRQRAESFFELLLGHSGTTLVVSHQTFLTQLHGVFRGLDTYHALATDIGILELNRFAFGGRELREQQRLSSMDGTGYASW